LFDLTFGEKYGAPVGKMRKYVPQVDVNKVFEEFNKRYPKIRRTLMQTRLEDYDWECAFAYVSEANIRAAHPTSKVFLVAFTRDDVVEIAHIEDGENDEKDWLCVGLLRDGRWFALAAGCDYTGWDCQASGGAAVGNTYEEVVRFGLSVDERSRLGITL